MILCITVAFWRPRKGQHQDSIVPATIKLQLRNGDDAKILEQFYLRARSCSAEETWGSLTLKNVELIQFNTKSIWNQISP